MGICGAKRRANFFGVCAGPSRVNRRSSEGSMLANRHGQFRYYNAQRCILEPSEAVCYPIQSQISIIHCLSTQKKKKKKKKKNVIIINKKEKKINFEKKRKKKKKKKKKKKRRKCKSAVHTAHTAHTALWGEHCVVV